MEVAKVTTFLISVNKINFDHLKYLPQNTRKVCEILNKKY